MAQAEEGEGAGEDESGRHPAGRSWSISFGPSAWCLSRQSLSGARRARGVVRQPVRPASPVPCHDPWDAQPVTTATEDVAEDPSGAGWLAGAFAPDDQRIPVVPSGPRVTGIARERREGLDMLVRRPGTDYQGGGVGRLDHGGPRVRRAQPAPGQDPAPTAPERTLPERRKRRVEGARSGRRHEDERAEALPKRSLSRGDPRDAVGPERFVTVARRNR